MDNSVGLIEVSAKLLSAIDEVVGSEHRSEFAPTAMETELRRRCMLDYVRTGEAAWKDEDHPELADGAYAYVRKLRDEMDRSAEAHHARRDLE